MNEFHDIVISRLVYGGDGLGRLVDGRAVFVPYVLPGEKVRIELIQEKRGHVRGSLVEIIEPDSQRITPRCPHFGICGGCHYQHMSYEKQLSFKASILSEQLERIGGLSNIRCNPAIPSPFEWNYRNHIQFHLNAQGEVGYQASRSKEVVPIRECHLPVNLLNEIWPRLDLDPIPGLELVSLRSGIDADAMLILESSDPQPIELSIEELPVSAIYLGPGGKLVLAGSDRLVFDVLDRKFLVSPESFFQVNTCQAAAMVSYLLKNLNLSNVSTLLDVYCGVGLFSAFLAPHVDKLVGIELSQSACEDFSDNLDEFDHVELYEAAAEEVLNNKMFDPELILVDPPRAGLGQRTLDGLLAQKARHIVYISCDPSTLARDAKRISASGYKLTQITPFDIFPQTFHIESISFWEI